MRHDSIPKLMTTLLTIQSLYMEVYGVEFISQVDLGFRLTNSKLAFMVGQFPTNRKLPT